MQFNNPILNKRNENKKKHMKTITKFVHHVFAGLAFACFALGLTPNAFAVSPAPDGNYPGFNTAEGDNALFSLTTGLYNTAVGAKALFSDTTSSSNTANGAYSLYSNTSGSHNTATGVSALYINTTGFQNTAVGAQALFSNTTGNNDTANGVTALYSNSSGSYNTASGSSALYSNTTGLANTAIGAQALYNNTTGTNTATGFQSLFKNTSGTGNVANGYRAIYSNSVGTGNVAIGSQTLQNNTTGNSNTAIGRLALTGNTGGSHNIALGENAGQNITTGGKNIDIGNTGISGDNGKIRIGDTQSDAFIAGLAHISPSATSIAGISGRVVAGAAVLVSGGGQLGVMASSQRFKDDIKPMDKASEAILALKPVSFRYKKEIDSNRTPQFGLVAEDVEKVNPDLVVHDDQGKVFTVRYEAVNAMLLNEFLKEHRTVQEQKATIAELKQELQSRLAEQQKQIETLTSGLQKVSAQVEISRPAPQTVVDNH